MVAVSSVCAKLTVCWDWSLLRKMIVVICNLNCVFVCLSDASAALQVRALKDYCNNYDLTSLNIKAGDVITVTHNQDSHTDNKDVIVPRISFVLS